MSGQVYDQSVVWGVLTHCWSLGISDPRLGCSGPLTEAASILFWSSIQAEASDSSGSPWIGARS